MLMLVSKIEVPQKQYHYYYGNHQNLNWNHHDLESVTKKDATFHNILIILFIYFL